MTNDVDTSFRQFVGDQRPTLPGTALLLTGDRTTAEVLVQVALSRSHRTWARLAGSGDPAAAVQKALIARHTGWRPRLFDREQWMNPSPTRSPRSRRTAILRWHGFCGSCIFEHALALVAQVNEPGDRARTEPGSTPAGSGCGQHADRVHLEDVHPPRHLVQRRGRGWARPCICPGQPALALAFRSALRWPPSNLRRPVMRDAAEQLAAAREAYGQRRWPEAHAAFAALRDRASLTADDLAALADAAWWLGRVDECIASGESAFQAYLREDRPRPAAMTAIGVAVNFFLRGDDAAGSGWVGRAARLLADEPECVEHGYLIYLLEVEGALDSPDRDAVVTAARRVRQLGRRYGDPNLVAISLLGEGRVLLRQGRVPEGMALFDEAMVYVLAGELLPDWAGDIYCHLMTACHELGDLRRARLWVEATSRWLETLPVAVLFTGICRVHRSQVLQATGAWEQSEREAARVCADLADIAGLSAAEGHYQLGELARLRGDLTSAERSYRRAHQLGRDPQPGFALLRMAQGRVDAAASSVTAALLAEQVNPLVRARLRAAHAEIALAAGDRQTAEEAVAELAEIAEGHASPGFTAAARQWRGAVLLASALAGEALPVLRAACRDWQGLQAPYDCARVRVLLAEAYRALGDADGAELELTAAAEVFDRLGARPDAAAVAARRGFPALPGGLTDREAEVLACLAAGHTNREIAHALVISEKTVARHLSNIFTKLGVASRTAATAWAHQHGRAG